MDSFNGVIGRVVLATKVRKKSQAGTKYVVQNLVSLSNKVFAEKEVADEVCRAAARPPINLCQIDAMRSAFFLGNLS